MGKHHKDPSSTGGGGSNDQDNKHEQKLQAVLFGDSFTDSFRPLTLSRTTPKVLCPLNNICLLDYSMEFLAGAGVEEIFVICVHGAKEVEEYVRNSKWSTCLGLQIHCICDSTCLTAGDALRELDKRSLVRSNPFILMNGDVVTNVNLLPILENHKKRYKLDSSNIMTMLFQRVGNNQETGEGGENNNNNNTNSNTNNTNTTSLLSSPQDDLVVGWNPVKLHDDYRMVLYDNKALSSKVTLPCEFFSTVSANLELHRNLLPVGLDVCSPEVLARFSDEFDYQDLYEQFVHESVLEEEEGLQSKIYAHLLNDNNVGGEYGARAKDFRSYHTISRDVMRRWCYPPVGLDNLPAGYETRFRYSTSRHYVYREVLGNSTTSTSMTTHSNNNTNTNTTSVVGRSTKVWSNVILGASVKVGEQCLLKGAVIGHNVVIGDSTKVIDSHIWNGVLLHDNVTLFGCIVAQDCVIHQGASIGKGCVLGAGVVIGSGVTIPPFTRLTACAKQDEADRDGNGFDDDDMFSSSSSSEEEDGSSSSEEDFSDNEEAGGVTFKAAATTGSTSIRDANTNNKSNFVSDTNVVGKDGYGRVWMPHSREGNDDDDSDDDDDSNCSDTAELQKDLKSYQVQSIGFDSSGLLARRRQAQFNAEEQAEDEEGNEQDNFSDEEWLDGDDEDMDDINNDEDAEFGAGALGNNTEGEHMFDGFASTGTLGGGGDNGHLDGHDDDDDMVKWGQQRGVDVVAEMKGLCLEHEKSNAISNLAIELNSFKFSQNASFADCSVAALLALLDRLMMDLTASGDGDGDDTTPIPPSAGKMVLALQNELEYWQPLFDKFRQSPVEEMAMLKAVESCALSAVNSEQDESLLSRKLALVLSTEPGFRFVLQTLEDKDIVKDATILKWAAERRRDADNSNNGNNSANSNSSAKVKLFLQKATQDYLEWLEQDDDDESSSGDEGSESGSDDNDDE
jgi:translation initiation factor eIF-2B subunit epsilon